MTAPPDKSSIDLDFPLLDAPFNFTGPGFTAPSMRQSMALSTDYYLTLHRALGGPSGSPRWRRWLVVGGDVISNWAPLGSGWLHEEWHRSVMSRRGISSRNDMNQFPIGREIIAVSHVTDEDLVRLKRDHPEEQVRLSSAGMESQIAQNLEMDRLHFFHGAETYDRIQMMLNSTGVLFYMTTCASRGADSSTDDQNRSDGLNVPKRDFTGLDCTAWTYDLFRPDEPYTARGTHPSGVGLDRYIRYSDLNDQERSFLRKQMMFSFANLVDPFLLGYDRFQTRIADQDVEWNAKLSHYLTSFGYTLDANLFLKWDESRQFLVQLHNGFNAQSYFPGVTVEWVEQPLPWDRLFLTHELTIWSQPRGQRVRSTQANTMVAGAERLIYKLGNYAPYLGVEAKTPGWMAGNVYLDRNLSVWTGLLVKAF